MKKKILTLGAISTTLVPLSIIISCGKNGSTAIFEATTPADIWLERNSWAEYIFSNQDGKSLNIPSFAKYLEDSNAGMFTNSKVTKYTNKNTTGENIEWKLDYGKLIGIEEDGRKIGSLFKEKLLKINLEAKTILEKKASGKKFAGIFEWDPNNQMLKFRLRELKGLDQTQDAEIIKVENYIADTADILDVPNEYHGHFFFAASRMNNGNGNIIEKDGKPKFTHVNHSGWSMLYENHIRWGTPEERKNGFDNAWKSFANTIGSTKTLVYAYPYIDYDEKILKVMVVTSQTGNIESIKGQVSYKDVLKNSTKISYKSIPVKNALPTLSNDEAKVAALPTQAEKDKVIKLIKHSFKWMAVQGGAKNLQVTLDMANKILPQLQTATNNLGFIMEKWKKQMNQIVVNEMQNGASDPKTVIKEHYVDLDVYKNIEKRKDAIIKDLIDTHFNFKRLDSIWNDLIGLDEDNPKYNDYDEKFVLESSGLDQNNISNLLWFFHVTSKTVVK